MLDRAPTPPGRHPPDDVPDISFSDVSDDASMQLDITPTRKRTQADESYLPTPVAHHDVEGKTPKRRKTESSLPSYVKLNVVLEAAKGLGPSDPPARCSVSGASKQMAVIEFAHVMSGSTPSNHLDRFEWSWEKPYFSLNVNTRWNIHPLSIDLHRLFDATKDNQPTGWFWVPTVDVLSLLAHMHTIYVGNDHYETPTGDFSNAQLNPYSLYGDTTKFSYRFIPLPDMEKSWSVRRYTGNLHEPLVPDRIQQSVYPFDDLPAFKLHVPYHFVIVNTGKKLFQLYERGEINFQRDFAFLEAPRFTLVRTTMRILRNLYVAWISSTPEKAWLAGAQYNRSEQGPPVDRPRREGAGSSPGGQGRGGASGSQGGGGGTGGRGSNSRGGSKRGGSKRGSGSKKGGKSKSGSGNQPQNTGAATRRRATAGSLTPWDSASFIEPLGFVDGTREGSEDEDESFVDEEDEEYEDKEFFDGVKEWASQVWTATHRDDMSDSQATMVGAPTDPVHSKDVAAASLIPALPSVH
ncbi:hypothetical protein M413DRAFT_77420 [Hebeloma cylindrosporum]|uniref:Uncharacterized protein n=1 Tax=Hebeloma cylindrosporum TaxID=76867 RepID=A0A0C3BYM5_HEBCY|nr:hypothetical protein M413DRAFT_77420 [Hebeloma cylindrosporum h7]